MNRGYCPEIKPLNIDLGKYDEVILGTPVWWYTFAPAMHTFLKKNDLSGKTIYPFATNGGWIGHTFKDFANACGTADYGCTVFVLYTMFARPNIIRIVQFQP